ncbi:hypothetical protein ILUMI_08045, partial [Ignelater luminosus]
MADPQSSNQAPEDIDIPDIVKLQPNVSENIAHPAHKPTSTGFSRLRIEWKANIFDIEVKTEDNLVNLKHLIYTAIQDELFRDLFSNIILQANLTENDPASQKLKWNSSGAELKVTAILSQHLSDLDIPSSIFYANKATRPHPSQFSAVDKAPHFKMLNKPRDSTKLVILDIDQTIYDFEAAGTPLSARPYLEDFLVGLYEYYEIGLWSATDMEIIEIKLDELGLLNNPMFKILFYAGANLLVPVCIESETVR